MYVYRRTKMSGNIPDLDEVGGMAKTFFNDVVQSVKKIVSDYKERHPYQAHTDDVTIHREEPGKEDNEASLKKATITKKKKEDSGK